MLKTPADLLLVLPLLVLAVACGSPAGSPSPAAPKALQVTPGSDPHSFARPEEAAVQNLALELTVDFQAKQIRGRASLTLDRKPGAAKLHLDTRGLDVETVTLDSGRPATWAYGQEDDLLGRALVVDLEPATLVVHVDYASRPDAAALQWLEPAQTAGGKQPFLFTQSQAILARTWIPLQDTPAVRFTYEAKVKVPAELLAVMSAENPTQKSADGSYRFTMPQAIPSYLMALSVGDLAFRSTGPRTGVYAEPPVAEKAAWEFAETEKMIVAAEALYGPYRWGRYDLLVLPPSFPFGGMENPRLTFATPTVIAGDRSLVSLVAHELAHSWSGNLVTNATWNDFWLNEGFTVYFEQRIMEAVYGRDYSEMLASLSLTELREEIETLGATSPDTHLRLSLTGRNPDDAVGAIAYQKGYFFLRTLEEAVGRETWDAFLKGYFDAHAFQSMTTDRFLAYLAEKLPAAGAEVNVQAWVDGPGLPEGAALPKSAAFERVDQELARFKSGTPAKDLAASGWTTHEKLHFLHGLLGSPVDAARLADLDQAWGLTASGNAEIQEAWFEVAIANQYQSAYPALEEFLLEVGRRKFLKPLYTALARTPEGKAWALSVYEKARPGYHSVSSGTIDEILGWGQPQGAAPPSGS